MRRIRTPILVAILLSSFAIGAVNAATLCYCCNKRGICKVVRCPGSFDPVNLDNCVYYVEK